MVFFIRYTFGRGHEVAGNTRPHFEAISLMPAKSKYYVFTINNPTESEETYFSGLITDEHRQATKITYLVIGREIGESGTRHFQGYVEFSQRLRLTQVKQLPGFGRAHLELRRGSAAEAAEYCLKDNDVLVEVGERSSSNQGARTDLVALQEVGIYLQPRILF